MILKYSIITEIKKSAKGNVYLASLEDYEFPVVVKALKHGDIKAYEALSQVESEHIPRILQVDKTEDGLLVAEEYIEGETLAKYIADNKLNEEGCIQIAKQLCAALKALHNYHPAIIHRDIKPSNIIIDSKGIVKLIDFDSTRFYKVDADSDTRLLGTEKYAPPEQYGFSQTDCRSDIYSLGVVLEKFTTYISSDKKKQWKKIVEKSTLFSPDSRFQSVEELEREINKLSITRVSRLVLWGIVAVSFIMIMLFSILIVKLSKIQAKLNSLQTNSNEITTVDETTTVSVTTVDETTTESITEEILDSSYQDIPPEWRDLESDPEVYVTLKKSIREHSNVVFYHFKDRNPGTDFLLNVRDFDNYEATLVRVSIISELNGWGMIVEEEDLKVEDNIVVIDRECMDSLETGYYMLQTILCKKNGEEFGSSVYLYVAETDVLKEPEMYLQNTTYNYHCGENEKLQVVLCNDSTRTIDKLLYKNGSEVDAALYTVLQNGRAMELSAELLAPLKNGGNMDFIVVCTDGSMLMINVNSIKNNN